MTTCMKVFSDYLDEKEIKHRIVDSNRILVGVNGKQIPNLRVTFIFDDADTNVAIRAYSIIKVPEAKRLIATLTCEALNNTVRFVKFCVDRDNDFNAEIDAVIEPYTAGKVCFELLIRLTEILDQGYSAIMKIMCGDLIKE